MKSRYVDEESLGHVLAALTPVNRVAARIALATGLRINDVLTLHTADVRKGRFSVREQKTGKIRHVRLSNALRDEALAVAGTLYVFPGRSDGRRPRTRQAVYKDLRRAAGLFRLGAHISPHSLRKAYAVKLYKRTGSLEHVQKMLNHGDVAVTMIYALADVLSGRKGEPRPLSK